MQLVIQQCYNKILNRDPDTDGLETYLSFLLKRPSSDLHKILKSSDEYILRIKPKKFINVFMCVRNNGEDIPKTFQVLEDIRRSDKNHEYRYFIFENDSTDNTVELCEEFIAKNHGVFVSDTLNKTQWGDVKELGRVTDMAIYRNKCKALCTDAELIDSSYCVLLDTKVTFKKDIFEKCMITLSDNTITMVTPFGKVGKRNVYYDTFALEFKSNSRHKYVKVNTGIIDVTSACGGVFMIRNEAFMASTWGAVDKNRSEHNAFCYTAGNFGRIVIDTSIHAEWVK